MQILLWKDWVIQKGEIYKDLIRKIYEYTLMNHNKRYLKGTKERETFIFTGLRMWEYRKAFVVEKKLQLNFKGRTKFILLI